jgi:hypothetical protein
MSQLIQIGPSKQNCPFKIVMQSYDIKHLTFVHPHGDDQHRENLWIFVDDNYYQIVHLCIT